MPLVGADQAAAGQAAAADGVQHFVAAWCGGKGAAVLRCRQRKHLEDVAVLAVGGRWVGGQPAR